LSKRPDKQGPAGGGISPAGVPKENKMGVEQAYNFCAVNEQLLTFGRAGL